MCDSTLFFGGNIITMEGDCPESVLVEDGVVRRTGRSCGQKGARPFDLKGATLLPAFIDSHSHITALAQTLGLAPLEKARCFGDIAAALRSFAQENPSVSWISGFGYDHNFLKEKAHPTRQVLDKAVGDRPCVIAHASGHMGVANTAALRILGITQSTPDPDGGRIGREPDGQPSGYLEETAFTSASIPRPGLEEQCRLMEKAQQVYLRYGITTVQDGYTRKPEWQLLKAMADSGRLTVDTVCYPDCSELFDLPDYCAAYAGGYHNRLRIGGYKIFLDGSPQGRTAWMSQPYLGAEKEYYGYPIYDDDQVTAFMEQALQTGRQLLAHCNGDAAAQQMIDAYARALQTTGKPGVRPVMIHAQLVRPDQLQRMAQLGMMASFFVAHTYYWGDIHLQTFGPQRAMRISPAKTALRAGVRFTLHQDSPVLPPDMLNTVWCAVNRVTRQGAALSQEECLTPYEALRAVTLDAAYQYGEEERKGSIRPGKLADFVVLDQNPLQTDPQAIKDIQVLCTIKEGRILYEKA